MKIRRTPFANTRKGVTWVPDETDFNAIYPHADTVHENDYPTHSPVLGPDGRPLRYEPRLRMGFALTPPPLDDERGEHDDQSN